MPLPLKITPIEHASANLTLDLTDYLTIQDKEGRDSERYQEWRSNFSRTLTDLGASELWSNLFDDDEEQRNPLSLSPDEVVELKNSPFYLIMINSFAEILANSIDQTIDRYYDAIEHDRDPNCILSVQLSLDLRQPETFSITIQDNAGGFNPRFLRSMNTQEQQIEYSQQKTVSAKTRDSHRVAHMGGRGLGLKRLLGEIYKDIDENVSAPPPVHFGNSLNHDNPDQSGAIITITLPRVALPDQYTLFSPIDWEDEIQESTTSPAFTSPAFTSLAATEDEDDDKRWETPSRSTTSPRSTSVASTPSIITTSTASSEPKKSGGFSLSINTDRDPKWGKPCKKPLLSPEETVSPIIPKTSLKLTKDSLNKLTRSFSPPPKKAPPEPSPEAKDASSSESPDERKAPGFK